MQECCTIIRWNSTIKKWNNEHGPIVTTQELEQINRQIVRMELKQAFVLDNLAIAEEYTSTRILCSLLLPFHLLA